MHEEEFLLLELSKQLTSVRLLYCFVLSSLLAYNIIRKESQIGNASVTNPFEAKMAAGLARWLLLNSGVVNVTIISPYQGQVSLIRKYLNCF